MPSGITVLLKTIHFTIFHSHDFLAEPSELLEGDPVIILTLGFELDVLLMKRFLTYIMRFEPLQYVLVVLT